MQVGQFLAVTHGKRVHIASEEHWIAIPACLSVAILACVCCDCFRLRQIIFWCSQATYQYL